MTVMIKIYCREWRIKTWGIGEGNSVCSECL